MAFVSSAFVVIAVPNDGTRTLSSYESELEQKIKTNNELRQFHIDIRQVTQLVDKDDLGDCFVVGLSFDASNCDDSNDRSGTDILLQELGGPNSEAWVTSTSPIPLAPPYGWKREAFVREPKDTKSICGCLLEFGLVIVIGSGNNQQQNALNNTKNEPIAGDGFSIYLRAKEQLNERVSLLEQTVRQNHPHITLGESAFGFQEYTHRGPGRFEVLFDPSSSLYQLLRNGLEPNWIDSVCQYLQQADASRLRLNISCVYSRPGATDQDWHTDGDHYHQGGTLGEPRDHQPYAVCIFVPLIPLTAETGFTKFWPQSHLYPNLLGLARAADALQATIDGVDMQPGDFVMYDYTTWHKGVGNTTKDVERPIVQFLYSCDWYKERKNYGTRSVFDPVSSTSTES